MRTVGNSALRGGQTVFHGLRMWGQLLRAALLLAAFSAVAVPAWTVRHRTAAHEWYAAAMVTVAEARLALGYARTSRQEVRQPDGRVAVLTVVDIANSPGPRAMRERLRDEVLAGAALGAKLAAAAIALFLALFHIRGRQLNRKRRIRGAANGPSTHGRKEAVKLILSSCDRTVGARGHAGSGKTAMLRCARALYDEERLRGPGARALELRGVRTGDGGVGSGSGKGSVRARQHLY